jgi:enoyl-CoA hydratase/carnithine racemase
MTPLDVCDANGVRTITLGPAAKLNALGLPAFQQWTNALETAAANDEISCVLVTGRGRAFTVGMDLDGDGIPQEEVAAGFVALTRALVEFPKPLVAAVNGLAVGFGTTVLGHCDITLAAASARFRLPFAGLGLVPEAGATLTLPRLLGPQATAHAFFTGSWLSANEALAAGLLLRVVPDADLAGAAREVCEQIAGMPIEALVATKRLLVAARRADVLAAAEREQKTFDDLISGPAFLAAVASFQARRQPAKR